MSQRARGKRDRASSSEAPTLAPPPPDLRLSWIVAAALAIVAFALYLPSLNNGFINWDDDKFLFDNHHFRFLLDNPYTETWDRVRWALDHNQTWEMVRWTFSREYYASNWYPLTWLSYAADIVLYGLDKPWGFHLTNLILHALNTGLLVLVLHRLTRRLWLSTIVAALFAVHPLHVESVGWVAERKDVLFTFFMFLALWAYSDYVRRPSIWRYLLVTAAFVAGLMSKPMILTLPFVLLFLDFWPLNRLSWRAVLEKIPLLALTVASILITYDAQSKGGAVRAEESLPFATRLNHAIYAYVMYQAKTFWPPPGTLVPFYPLPDRGGTEIPPLLIQAMFVFLLAMTTAAALLHRKWPYLVVGWLIYVWTLGPVIGLVQVGKQIMADRYTYVPLIGVFVALVWLLDDLASRVRGLRWVGLGLAALVVAGLSVLTWQQQAMWRDSRTVWEAVLRLYPKCATALNNMGHYWSGSSVDAVSPPDIDKAIEYYSRAVESAPTDYLANCNLANNLMKKGRLKEAEAYYQRVLAMKPTYAPGYNGYGTLLIKLKRYDDAIRMYQQALKHDPYLYHARLNMGAAMVEKGDYTGAIALYQNILRDMPNLAQAYYNMGIAYDKLGRKDEAQRSYAQAQRLRGAEGGSKGESGK